MGSHTKIQLPNAFLSLALSSTPPRLDGKLTESLEKGGAQKKLMGSVFPKDASGRAACQSFFSFAPPGERTHGKANVEQRHAGKAMGPRCEINK